MPNSKSKVEMSRYGHAGEKEERKYCSYSFLTSALDEDEWSASRLGRSLPPRRTSDIHWTSELVWTQRLGVKCFASAGDRIPVVQSIVRHILTELSQLRSLTVRYLFISREQKKMANPCVVLPEWKSTLLMHEAGGDTKYSSGGMFGNIASL
jgi:hypothetical protein